MSSREATANGQEAPQAPPPTQIPQQPRAPLMNGFAVRWVVYAPEEHAAFRERHRRVLRVTDFEEEC